MITSMKPSTAESVNSPIPGPRPIPLLIACLLIVAAAGPSAQAQPESQVINLTVERMIELGLRDSYQVQRLVLEVERTRSNLRAEQAGLKSRVELEVLAPEFEAITDYKWNSTLQRNELVHENTRRAQAILSVRQPVILFGYPTDGYLSLNTRIYRYSQLAEERDVRYYNRYFVAYEQPLFQPNEMRHDLEEAELDLEEAEIDYQNEVIEMLDDLSDEYFELLEAAYERVIAESRVAHLEAATAAARTLAPRLRNLAIQVRGDEIDLAQTKGRDSFRVDLELTYGRETQNESLRNLWEEPKNSYTVNVEATIPIWDWGERRHRITASEYSLQRTQLQVEDTETEIVTDVRNVILSLEEYELRALNMQENLALATRVTASSLDRYGAGEIALVDLLQTLNREEDTAASFMDAYMGFHQQLLRLRQLTHYDFEYDMPVAERFPVTPGAPQR